MQKAPDAFRTISEVAEDLDLPQHVLRFWETRFTQIKPMKRGGGRRYYRPDDITLLRGIRHLLYSEGYTIKGVQRILKEQGVRFVIDGADLDDQKHDDVKMSAPIEKRPVELMVEKSAPPPVPEKAVEKPTASKPSIATLAASYESPEALQSVPSSAPPKVAQVVNDVVAPFTLTHNVPGHLVDAITSGESIVETVTIAESKAVSDEKQPFDILPENADEGGSVRMSGRGLLKRLKSGGAQDGAHKGSEGEFVLLADDAQRLQETLIDLLECKRLLDQIR